VPSNLIVRNMPPSRGTTAAPSRVPPVALTSSHLAMIRVVGELGSFRKWAAFYEHYA